ncbi:hypothetical protein SRHO_G00016450 [Serrasalmus rhombeus]
MILMILGRVYCLSQAYRAAARLGHFADHESSECQQVTRATLEGVADSGSIKANGGSLKRESCLAWAGHGGPTPGQTLQRNSSVIGLCEAGQAPTLLLSSPTKGERMN